MKIFIITKNGEEKILLVQISNKKNAIKIKALISKRLCKKAIEKAFEKGQIIKEVSREYLGLIDADLILTENTVHYDLMNK